MMRAISSKGSVSLGKRSYGTIFSDNFSVQVEKSRYHVTISTELILTVFSVYVIFSKVLGVQRIVCIDSMLVKASPASYIYGDRRFGSRATRSLCKSFSELGPFLVLHGNFTREARHYQELSTKKKQMEC